MDELAHVAWNGMESALAQAQFTFQAKKGKQKRLDKCGFVFLLVKSSENVGKELKFHYGLAYYESTCH